MKKTNTTTKFAPRFISDNEVQVTKEFAKNARIFGTPEYKMWKEIKQDCTNAVMVPKTIKKNTNKQTSTKNMTYERMAIYIRQQNEAVTLMAEFKKQIALSQIQTNPYRCVLAWFMQTFSNYDDYKTFFAEEAKKQAKEKDIFTLVEKAATVKSSNSEDAEEELDLVSGL